MTFKEIVLNELKTALEAAGHAAQIINVGCGSLTFMKIGAHVDLDIYNHKIVIGGIRISTIGNIIEIQLSDPDYIKKVLEALK